MLEFKQIMIEKKEGNPFWNELADIFNEKLSDAYEYSPDDESFIKNIKKATFDIKPVKMINMFNKYKNYMSMYYYSIDWDTFRNGIKFDFIFNNMILGDFNEFKYRYTETILDYIHLEMVTEVENNINYWDGRSL